MCSTPQERIAAFGRAIEDFALGTRSETVSTAPQANEQTAGRSADGPAATARPIGVDGARPSERASAIADGGPGNSLGAAEPQAPGDALRRLAELWAELATLDPEVAKRLPIYEA
jgi:hypothetical protein